MPRTALLEPLEDYERPPDPERPHYWPKLFWTTIIVVDAFLVSLVFLAALCLASENVNICDCLS